MAVDSPNVPVPGPDHVPPPPVPVTIGVAGGSGSGKTTVVRRIVESIGDDHLIVLEHDRRSPTAR